MLTEGNARYNKAGINPALLWNKAVPNSTFRPEVDMDGRHLVVRHSKFM